MAVAVSEQSLAALQLSAPLCIGSAVLLAMLCGLLAWQAAADRRTAQPTAEERSHLDV
jgi:hypothetical protein